MSIQETFNKYFPVVEGNKEKPYLVLFDALIGYGKSYVARRLAELDGSVIVDNNQVRYRLNDYDDKLAEQWHELQNQRIKELLANGNSLIIDECLPINYQKKLDFYRGLGYPVFIVRLDCDKDVWAERLKRRRFNPPEEYSVINYDDAVELNSRYPAHVPDELVDFTIDTADNVDEQIDKLASSIALRVNGGR